MDAPSKYYAARITAWVNVYDRDTGAVILDRAPVATASMTFTLGAVAEASFVLNVGQDIRTLQQVQLTGNTGKLRNRPRVELWLKVDGAAAPGQNWPTSAFRAWDGFVIGASYTGARGSTSFAILASHWVSELDTATLLSQALVKNSYDNNLAVVSLPSDNGAQFAGLESLAMAVNANDSDVWSGMILPMLLTVMGQVTNGKEYLQAVNWFDTVNKLSMCSAPGETSINPQLGNQLVADILNKRFNLSAQIVQGFLPSDQLKLAAALGVQDNIIDALASLIGSRIGAQTALDKIMAAASHFQFNLIHNTESATLAPLSPVLNTSTVWRTITTSEYDRIEARGAVPRRLAGVALVGTDYDQTDGKDRPQDGQQGNVRVAGAWVASTEGQIHLYESPEWLAPSTSYKEVVRTVLGGRGLGTPAPTGVQTVSQILSQRVPGSQQIGCAMAHTLWANEVYANRSATLQGRLRFDICQGSTIQVRGTTNNLPNYAADDLYALVTSVTVMIDSMSPAAGTRFTLSHLRTADEAAGLPPSHPIYQTVWPGSPLVKLTDQDLIPEQIPS